MHLSVSKVIAILCISIIISFQKVLNTSTCHGIAKAGENVNKTNENVKKNNNNNNNTFYELNILNKYLDYQRLRHAIIIYSYSPAQRVERQQDCLYHNNNTGIADNFLQLSLISKLTANYHMKFINVMLSAAQESLFQVSTHRLLVFMKYYPQAKGKQKILQLSSQKEKFTSQFVWLIAMDEMHAAPLDIEDTFGQLNLMINTDLTVAIKSKDNAQHYDLYEVHKICHLCGAPLEIIYKGNWTIEKGLQILKEFHYGIAVRRSNFKKYAIKAATTILNKSPDLNITDLEYLNNDKQHLEEDAMQRKTFQLLQHMLYLYNATFDVKIASTWGRQVNGSWSGVIGLLHRGEAELSLCPLRYLAKRTKYIVYTSNIHYEKIHFIFRHPKHASIRNIFFEPLGDLVWWCVLALIVVTILQLAIHVHIEYKVFMALQQQQQQQLLGRDCNDADADAATAKPLLIHNESMIVENHFDFIVLCIMEAILMQGPTPNIFRCNSTRLLILSVSVFSILLMQFYGAFIVSSLLSEPPRSITNLQALYNSSIELGMENVSYNYDVFINNTNPLIGNVYKHRICNKRTQCRNIVSLEEGVRRITAGNFAFHVAIDRAYRLLKSSLTESQFCELQEIMFNPPYTFYCGLGIRKQSPYYEFISRAIIMFHETALVPYNDKKWEVNKIDCSTIRGDQVEVDLEHFVPALAFLFLAYVFSLLALFVEIAYKNLTQKKNLIFNTKH